MNSLTQKEYLKKYLGIGKDSKQKKKKKKEKTVGGGLKVVDEDLDVALFKEIQDDLSAANEDAPQIVAVIDDRPPSLRVDEETKSNLWKPIGEPSDLTGNKLSMKLSNSFKLNSTNKPSLLKSDSHKTFKKPSSKYREDKNETVPRKNVSSMRDDHSPPRRALSNSQVFESNEVDESPPRKIKQEKLSPTNSNEDMDRSLLRTDSYPKRRRDSDGSPSRKYTYLSPQRRNKAVDSRNRDSDSSPPRRNKSSDISPPGLNKITDYRKRDEDISPPRRSTCRDLSPPRRSKVRLNNEVEYSPPRKISRDLSPPRRKDKDKDILPPRRHRSPDHRNDRLNKRPHSDNKVSSPPRKVSRDNSPPRRTERLPLADKIKTERNSPARQSKERKSRWADNSPSSSGTGDKIEKTLSGKKAGLQDARGITKELIALREKEDELFRNMSDDISGANAATIVRGKKQVDTEEQAAQKMKEKEMKEKYDRWGKGLKQVGDQNQKFADQLHEMSKPLARYADDEDLERYLKEQEREGDPMLAYIRKKKRKKAVDAGVPEKPQYMGEFMPNRFGIVPGYRWDGVDRSNGYERKWFETQNKKRAMQEEAHKWSTEDM